MFVPQFHYYSRNGYDTKVNRNYFLSLDLGYRVFNPNKKHYFTIYGSLGQLIQNEVLTNVVSLSTGDVNEGEMQQRYYFVPNIVGDYGLRLSNTVDFYTRLSVGQKISLKYTSATTLYIGLGTKLYLSR